MTHTFDHLTEPLFRTVLTRHDPCPLPDPQPTTPLILTGPTLADGALQLLAQAVESVRREEMRARIHAQDCGYLDGGAA